MEFYKVHSTGNDFILVDDRTLYFPQDPHFIAKLCHRRLGIGADGLILLQLSSEADVKMVYFNADGGAASFCGNGLRATAFLARRLALCDHTLTIESGSSLHTITFEDDRIAASMPEPASMRLNLVTEIGGRDLNLHFVDTGVPHVVCFVPQIDSDHLMQWAKEIRSHLRFGREGVNCNFARLNGEGLLLVRTYERGVEAETLSCGSGGAAVYWIARALFGLQGGRRVRFFSGEEIDYDYREESLIMTGSVTPVYKGILAEQESDCLSYHIRS